MTTVAAGACPTPRLSAIPCCFAWTAGYQNLHVGARKAQITAPKGKSRKKPTPAKKAAKGRNKATCARQGSKTAKVLDLLKRSGGATLGDYESHRLAGAFGSRLPVRHAGQENETDGHIYQGQRRGAQLLGESLSATNRLPHAAGVSPRRLFFV
jgi:hypothetical protein